MEIAAGTVYWITGLSGAGKTTLGQMVYETLRAKKPNVFRLDGDIARWAYNDVTDFSLAARRECAFRHARVCKMIADQGIDVVCCTISMFDDVRAWNRENFAQYMEIFLDVPMEVLIARNKKGMYSQASEGKMKNVMGIDQKLELPRQPDVHFINEGTEPLQEVARRLHEAIGAAAARKGIAWEG